MEYYSQQAPRSLQAGNMKLAIQQYLLSLTPDAALPIGIQLVEAMFKSEGPVDVEAVSEVLTMLQSVRSSKVSNDNVSMQQLLAYSAYIGALKAIEKGYDTVVFFLIDHACNLIDKHKLSLPVTKDTIMLTGASYLKGRRPCKCPLRNF
eukprot:Colp12_sorted_trinity150504_noHs@3431